MESNELIYKFILAGVFFSIGLALGWRTIRIRKTLERIKKEENGTIG